MKEQFKRLLKSVNVGYATPMSLAEKVAKLESDPNWTTLDLPIDGEAVEEVLVERLGEGRYRLASSPGKVQGLAADDQIAVDPDGGYRLAKRGGNVCVHLYCEASQRDRVQSDLDRVLGRIGGVLDGHMGTTGLCYTIPVAAGFSVIEGELGRVVGDEWSYSNVLDPETGEPLNWWLKK